MKHILIFALLAIVLTTTGSFTKINDSIRQSHILTSWHYVGHFTADDTRVYQVYVDNDNPSQIVVGKYSGSSTIYFASGTYDSSDNTVSNFQMEDQGRGLNNQGTYMYPDPAYTGSITY